MENTENNNNDDEQQKISKFFEYLLLMMLHGFDEMEMQKRLEMVKLTGFMLNHFYQQTYNRINNMEDKIDHLEEEIKK